MGVLKDLAARAVDVEVAGNTIGLRYPNSHQRTAIRDHLKDLDLTLEGGRKAPEGDEGKEARVDSSIDFAHCFRRIAASCLSYTVIDNDDMTVDDYDRMIEQSNNEPEKFEGLDNLVKEALRLCGLDSFLRSVDDGDGEGEGEDEDEDEDEAPKGVTDHVKEAGQAAGAGPSSPAGKQARKSKT